MSWTLLFFRRVGQPELTLPEVEAFFGARPELHREVTRDPAGDEMVSYSSEAGAPVRHLYCTFWTAPAESAAPEPGAIDFPYEETALRLSIDYLESAEVAAAGTELALALCRELELFCLDPQSGAETPLAPDAGTLRRSYADADAELRATIAFALLRRRQFLLIAGVLLAVSLLLFLAPLLRPR